jgi:hypothetical protein
MRLEDAPATTIPDPLRPVLFTSTREEVAWDASIIHGHHLRTGRDDLCVVMVTSSGTGPLVVSGCPGIASIHAVDIHPAQTAYASACQSMASWSYADQRDALIGPVSAGRKDLADRYPVLTDEPLVFQGRYDRFWRMVGRCLASHGVTDAHGFVEACLSHPHRMKKVLHRCLMDLGRWFPEASVDRHTRSMATVVMHRMHQYDQPSDPASWLTDDHAWMRQDIARVMGWARDEDCLPVWMQDPWRTAMVPELIQFHTAPMTMALARMPTGSCDVIDLSNILCWMNDSDRNALMKQVMRTLRPDGIVIHRWLLGSGLMFPGLRERARPVDRSLLIAGMQVLYRTMDGGEDSACHCP